jgi:hypothetical protein
VRVIAAGVAAVGLLLVVLFVTGVFDSDGPSPSSPAPTATATHTATATPPATRSQVATPLQGSLAPPTWLVLLAALVAAGALFYRRPRWTGQLTLQARREIGPGYHTTCVLIPDRLGRALVDGRLDAPGVMQLPRTTARVKVSARRSWRHPRRIDLVVRVRLADSGRRDTVRCPAGGRRMVLGLDVRHSTEARPLMPPPPTAPPPPPPPAAPYHYPAAPNSPTIVAPFPPSFPNPNPGDPGRRPAN